MNRLGLLPPTSLVGEQKEAYDVHNNQIDLEPSNHVASKDEEGCLLGPAGALIHNPDMLEHCNGLHQALTRTIKKSGLPQNVFEIASLVVGARTQAAYEIYAHSRSSGFPQAYLDDIRQGYCPLELDEKCQMAFEVATELGKPGSLLESTWQKSVNVLGVEGTAALVQCVGYHTFLSTVANGFDVQLPAAASSCGSTNPPSAKSARSSVSFEKSELTESAL